MTDRTNDKYAYLLTKEASERYVEKMLQLGTREELKAFVPATPLKDHLMFCIDRIVSQDGKRTYEFLIEYHTKRPSEGIYYGCRGITKEGCGHKNQIEQFVKDWETVRPVLTQQLDNNLPDYDAAGRYRMTDNADNNTYWLFWISLRDNEDIREIGLRATTIIRNVFNDYLSNPESFLEKSKLAQISLDRKSQRQRETTNSVMPFTEEAYNSLIHSHPVEVENFIKAALSRGWIEENRDFGQYALRFVGCNGHQGNVDFALMIHSFFDKHLHDKAIPWVQIQQVFIDFYGSRYVNLRGQIAQAQSDTRLFWRKAIDSLS